MEIILHTMSVLVCIPRPVKGHTLRWCRVPRWIYTRSWCFHMGGLSGYIGLTFAKGPRANETVQGNTEWNLIVLALKFEETDIAIPNEELLQYDRD